MHRQRMRSSTNVSWARQGSLGRRLLRDGLLATNSTPIDLL